MPCFLQYITKLIMLQNKLIAVDDKMLRGSRCMHFLFFGSDPECPSVTPFYLFISQMLNPFSCHNLQCVVCLCSYSYRKSSVYCDSHRTLLVSTLTKTMISNCGVLHVSKWCWIQLQNDTYNNKITN